MLIAACKGKRQMTRNANMAVAETLEKDLVKDAAAENPSSFVGTPLKHQAFVRETLKAQRKTQDHHPPPPQRERQRLGL